jgi:hypothetical protein
MLICLSFIQWLPFPRGSFERKGFLYACQRVCNGPQNYGVIHQAPVVDVVDGVVDSGFDVA